MHNGAKTKKTKQKLTKKKIVRYIEKRLKQLQKNHPDPYVPDSPKNSIHGNSSKKSMNAEVNASVPSDSPAAAQAPEGAKAPPAPGHTFNLKAITEALEEETQDSHSDTEMKNNNGSKK